MSDDSYDNQPPVQIEGLHGQQFKQYPLQHPANLKPSYRKKKINRAGNGKTQMQYKKPAPMNFDDHVKQVQNMTNINTRNLPP